MHMAYHCMFTPDHKILVLNVFPSQTKDYFIIRDGVNESALVLKNFTTKPGLDKRWASSDKYLWIRFKSDKEDVAMDFNLTWRTIPLVINISVNN